MKYEYKTITTSRLTTSYIRAGEGNEKKLLLIHGNVSSAIFYEKFMEKLEDKYDMVALDLRCFGNSDALPIDATRGLRDFTDDIDEFVEAIGWKKFSILGWSLGGGITMQYVIDHSDKIEKVVLQAPLSPFGYGGTYDATGSQFNTPGLGTGAGCANQALITAILLKDREFIKSVIEGVYVAKGYRLDPEFEEELIDAILLCKIGEDMCQGDYDVTDEWPYVLAGKKGVSNTMAANYCNLSPLTDIINKPDILWIRGDKDIMVGDSCAADIVTLGKLDLIPGYPGEDKYPGQPMVSQTRYVLDKYKDNGGKYEEIVLTGSGHGPILDNLDKFACCVISFI